MLGVHSLAPAKLYVGTTTVQRKPTIRRVVSEENEPVPLTNEETSAAPVPIDQNSTDSAKDTALSSPRTFPLGKETASPGQVMTADSGPRSEMAEVRAATAAVLPTEAVPHETPSKHREEQPPVNMQASADTQPETTEQLDVPTPAAAKQSEDATIAGPSRPVSEVPQHVSDSTIAERDMAYASRPDESRANAITYRRDPETVIAYLVPLPQPTVQGKALDVTPRYFLYAPPPPHLVKPAHGSEGYAIRLTRHWQQSVRRAKINAHNGKKLSWRGTRSKVCRGIMWGLNKLKYDDVAFLARIHPKTVNHLILIHPSDLSAAQTPEEILATFRDQMFASKKRAKRNSIISAALFLPALAIDTAAVFFGGLAEIDGIWMLVSITAYRTARLITQKMGPDPRTLQISQEKLIEDARKLHPHPEKSDSDDESETGAIRRSVDALRRGVGSIKHRMSQRKGRKSESRDRKSTDTSRPQTRASEGFVGHELENHAEEDPAEVAAGDTSSTGGDAAGVTSPTAASTSEAEFSGVLEHGVEEEVSASPSRPSGGIFQDDDAAAGEETALRSQGQNFQLTFYPSPAMDVLDRYMQNSCQLRNCTAFTGPSMPPTAGEVLAVMGWRPERRQHLPADQQQEDEAWQAREIEDDLRLVAAKAAKSWDKACHKEARRSKRPSGHKIGFARKVQFRRPQMVKGKSKQISPDTSDAELAKPSKTSGLKQKLGAMRKKSDKTDAPNDGGKGGKVAKAAALLCLPAVAVAQRVQHIRQNDDTQEEKKKPSLKDRLAARKASMMKRKSQQDGDLSNGTSTDAPDDEDSHGKKSKAGIFGGLAAAIVGLKEASKHKMRERKEKSASQSEKPSKDNKRGPFSILKERVKALRTRVFKIPSKLGITSRVRGLKEKRKSRSEAKKEETQQGMPDRDLKSTKTHGAMVGLVAGCLALPGAKVKELREKRKSNKSTSADDDDNNPADLPAPVMNMSGQSTRSNDRIITGLTLQAPVPIPEEEEPSSSRTTQYLPGHGQSEIPVVTPPEMPRTGSGLNAQEQQQQAENTPQIQISDEDSSSGAAAAAPPASTAAAVKFRSIRNGMTTLTTRATTAARRSTSDRPDNGGNAAEGDVTAATTNGRLAVQEDEQREPSSPFATSPRRFTFYKNLRPKGRNNGSIGQAALEGQQEDSAATPAAAATAHPTTNGDELQALQATDGNENSATTATDANAGAAPKRNGFGNFNFNKKKGGDADDNNNTEKSKQYKDRGPGFLERMRTMWYMA